MQDLVQEILGARLAVFWVVEKLVFGAVFQNAPAHVDEDHAVGHFAGKAHFVRDHHHGHAFVGQCTITSSTSPTISGSSAEVGSSNSITMGSIDKARAMATRCCWPPESWPGNLSLCANQAHAVEHLQAPLAASSSVRPSTLIWAIVRFSVTDRCGKEFKTLEHHAHARTQLGQIGAGVHERHAIDMDAALLGPAPRPLTVLMRVDLPEPEGPQTTTTSPLLMLTEQSLSTCTGPYHLETFLISIIFIPQFQHVL
jgi:hypothetical protein